MRPRELFAADPGRGTGCTLRDAMFRGERINITEDRAVLHTALCAPRDAVIEVDGENVVWLLNALDDDAAVARHFVALSTNAGKVAE